MDQEQDTPALRKEWEQIKIAGHRCRIYEPPTPSEHGYTLLYLHGRYQGTPAESPQLMQRINEHGLRVIAPLMRRCWFADRICSDFDAEITPEQYLLNEIIPYVKQRWDAEPPQIALMGASMGGQAVLRLSYKYPDRFPVVTAFFPAIDFHKRLEEGDKFLNQMYRDAEDARQDTATLHIHPLNWPRHQWFCCDPVDTDWYDSVDRLRMKLYSLGVAHECDLETSAGGHSWEYVDNMAQKAMDFLMRGLEQERLRVV